MNTKFDSFTQVYPYYLSEHQNPTCRRLHFIGSLLTLVLLLDFVINQRWLWLLSLPFVGYGFAWVGHFFFEHNKPATFRYPLYSFMGDWVMFKDILLGKIKI